MPKILVCVGDAQLFLLLRHLLANEGFDAQLVTRPCEVEASCRRNPAAAAMIDWTEGPFDRIALLAAVKSLAPSSAVILLSKHRNALDASTPTCDLLLDRPFVPGILFHFLRQLRYRHISADYDGDANDVLRFADLTLNLATVKVYKAGNEVSLTALQFRLLRRLMQRPSTVCQRDELIESCWPPHVEVEPRTVDIHIGHIRRALGGLGPELIRTVRGNGYALEMPYSNKALKPFNS
ncbi:winged-helix domain-containing protein [Rhizobium sp. Root482]|uniref:winged helix-turn-helix transcriptional regulator n=1 Tax=Rhizobium sp. Root482 TaxID=1736543 RepID=UPI000729993A|nr:response regulator transcription factor [Rhizobium sp. Root482]KQY18568.1 hypothetical protein ASD31_24525 [Rhizobium sp. Root482]